MEEGKIIAIEPNNGATFLRPNNLLVVFVIGPRSDLGWETQFKTVRIWKLEGCKKLKGNFEIWKDEQYLSFIKTDGPVPDKSFSNKHIKSSAKFCLKLVISYEEF